jgi:uncharacterized Tic20 family protein
MKAFIISFAITLIVSVLSILVVFLIDQQIKLDTITIICAGSFIGTLTSVLFDYLMEKLR